MNAALEQVEPSEAQEMSAVAELRAVEEKKAARRAQRRLTRKENEVKRRFVLTLTHAETVWVNENFERLGYDSGPALLRDMAFVGLKATGGPSARQIEIQAREDELARLRAEADEDA